MSIVQSSLGTGTRRSRAARHEGGGQVGVGGWLGMVMLGVLVVVAVLAPVIAANPNVAVGEPFAGPSIHHLLGTDDIGEDLFARVLFGLRTSLATAAVVIALGVAVGALVGVVAGTAGGWVDAVLMRLTDLFLTLPGPILAIAIVAALGPSLVHTTAAVAVVWWPWYARLVRNEVRALAVRPHVDAARLSGVSTVRLMRRHLLPGTFAPVLVAASLDVQIVVLTLAGLSFLGLGSPPPSAELGAMAARGSDYLVGHPMIPLAPGVAIFLLAFAANLAGDGIRDLIYRQR
jgi:peptide/nickel transport system permease protein